MPLARPSQPAAMSFAAGRAPERKTNFKKTIDADEARRGRMETTVQIRKNMKERNNQRRRMGVRPASLAFRSRERER